MEKEMRQMEARRGEGKEAGGKKRWKKGKETEV